MFFSLYPLQIMEGHFQELHAQITPSACLEGKVWCIPHAGKLDCCPQRANFDELLLFLTMDTPIVQDSLHTLLEFSIFLTGGGDHLYYSPETRQRHFQSCHAGGTVWSLIS